MVVDVTEVQAGQRVPVGRSRLAGAVAALVALAVGELVSSLHQTGPTLVDAVGTGFIDRFGAPLKDFAVTVFGDNHKTALIIGIWTVAAAIGARLGRLAVTRPWAARAGFAVAGLFGVIVHALEPTSSIIVGGIAGTAAVATGWVSLDAMVRAATPTATAVAVPGAGVADRRRFLTTAAATTAGAGAVVALGRLVRSAEPTPATDVALPAPVDRVDVPAATGIDVDGVTPYITPIGDFFRIDTALRVPRVDATSWRLSVTGMVNTPLEITHADLLAMDAVSVPVTIACVSNEIGGDLVGTAVWQGVPLVDLLDRAGVDPAAEQVFTRSVDGFTAGFPTSVLTDDRTAIVAYAMNGEPLPELHGFPARLVVSGLYGYVSATKWLAGIELTRWDGADGYWIPRGWSKEGPVKIASRIDVPGRGDIAAGPTAVAGIALAPGIGIAAVEVSVDDGPWQSATLGRVASDDTWVQWSWTWDAPPGEHTLSVRATDARGTVQTAERAPVDPDGATGHHRRRVVVRT
ncbi:MAG: molybdopterin-dependent oxidoreductase [Ilumatobacteraceae bacterium]